MKGLKSFLNKRPFSDAKADAKEDGEATSNVPASSTLIRSTSESGRGGGTHTRTHSQDTRIRSGLEGTFQRQEGQSYVRQQDGQSYVRSEVGPVQSEGPQTRVRAPSEGPPRDPAPAPQGQRTRTGAPGGQGIQGGQGTVTRPQLPPQGATNMLPPMMGTNVMPPTNMMPPRNALPKVDFHLFVKHLSHEAMVRTEFRNFIGFILYVIVILVVVLLQTDISEEYTVGRLLSTSFVERRFGNGYQLRDAHNVKDTFSWLGGVWAPSVFQDSSFYQYDKYWLDYNTISSPLTLDTWQVKVGACGDDEVGTQCIIGENIEKAALSTAFFYPGNLLNHQFGTRGPVYVPSAEEWCRVDYTSTHAGKCPTGWSFFRGNCYQYFPAEVTFSGAVAGCQARQATVAVAPSELDHQFLASLLPIADPWYAEREDLFTPIWLGATEGAGTGWSWGSPNALYPFIPDYSRWTEPAPNARSLNFGGRCLQYSADGLWMAVVCESERLPYICQRPPDDPTTQNDFHCQALDYSGAVSETADGTACLPWNTIDGTRYAYLGASAECRTINPTDDRPWCFTSASSWDYCDVPVSPSAGCFFNCTADSTKTELASNAVANLYQQNWFNGSDAYLSTEFNIYNHNYRMNGLLRIIFVLQPSGLVVPFAKWTNRYGTKHKGSYLQVQRTDYYHRAVDWFRFSFEVIFLILSVGLGCWGIYNLWLTRKTWRYSWTQFWVLYDLFVSAAILTLFIMWCVQVSKVPAQNQANSLQSGRKTLCAIVLLFLGFRGVYFLKFPLVTRRFYVTLREAAWHVLKFLVFFLLTVFSYAVAGLYFFGFVLPQFDTLPKALATCLFLAVGDWSIYGTLTSAVVDGQSGFFPLVYFWSYFFLLVFLVLNLFIGVVVAVCCRHYLPRPAKAGDMHYRLKPSEDIALLTWRNLLRHPLSFKAENLLTVMEAHPWVETALVGLRADLSASVTLADNTLHIRLKLLDRYKSKLLEGGTILIQLPSDVIITASDAWRNFLQKTCLKPEEAMNFSQEDLTALMDEHGIKARERNFVRQHKQRLENAANGIPSPELNNQLRAAIRHSGGVSPCLVDVIVSRYGPLVAVTSVGGIEGAGGEAVEVAVMGIHPTHSWRRLTKCRVHPTRYNNLIMVVDGEHPLPEEEQPVTYYDPVLVVRSNPNLTTAELEALLGERRLSMRSIVRRDDQRYPYEYKRLMKNQGQVPKAVLYGAKVFGVVADGIRDGGSQPDN